ncbi:MAG TPA: hypothetical protein VEB40_07490 [Flavipsychrobacter sp.]|nr:hypothetical protein [Flavipsychrobacter sp.]
MAKASKPQSNRPAQAQDETVIETAVNQAEATEVAKHREEYRHEIELKHGQCIVAPINSQDEEIVTTLDDWNSLYNAGANQGRFVLKAEKKS